MIRKVVKSIFYFLSFLLLPLGACFHGELDSDFSEIVGRWEMNGSCTCNAGIADFTIYDIETDYYIIFKPNGIFIDGDDENTNRTRYIITGSKGKEYFGVIIYPNDEKGHFIVTRLDAEEILVFFEGGDEGTLYRFAKGINNLSN